MIHAANTFEGRGVSLSILFIGTFFLTPWTFHSPKTLPTHLLLSYIYYLLFRVSLSDLRSENPLLAQRLRHDPLRHLRALEAACHAIAAEERPGYDKDGE